MKNLSNYVKFAEDAWNEAAPIHWRVTQKLLDDIKSPDRRDLQEVQIEELRRIDISGKRVAQLNCNNGRELITIKRLGAGPCVGFDIAEGFISQARWLAEAAGVNCQFVCSDAYKIGHEHDRQFDVVVITAGALAFMPDLLGYFQVAHRLLRPQGYLTIHESHPVTRMFLKDRDRKEKPIELVYSYFSDTPLRHETGLDYQGGTTYNSSPVYYFPHKMSDIINSCIEAGFSIERFTEHDQDPSQARKSLESMEAKPPLSYILTARS